MKSSYQAQHIESPAGELGIHEFLACVYDAIRSLLQARRLQRSTRMGWGVDTPMCRPCGRRRWIARRGFNGGAQRCLDRSMLAATIARFSDGFLRTVVPHRHVAAPLVGFAMGRRLLP